MVTSVFTDGQVKRRVGTCLSGLSVFEVKAWNAWQKAKQRCYNPDNPKYYRYGRRGIRMCARWRNSFFAFLADVGAPKALHLSLGRRDNDKGYEPGNVRWETAKQQANNRKQSRMRGSTNGNSKLSEDKAREVKRRALAGEPYNDIAQHFSISKSTVSAIKTGRLWPSL